MAKNSYTSSERKGILVIALVALLIIGSGVVLALCGRPRERVEEIPVVVEYPEAVDSTYLKNENETKKNTKSKTKNTTSSATKTQKIYRKRSPLDEPV